MSRVCPEEDGHWETQDTLSSRDRVAVFPEGWWDWPRSHNRRGRRERPTEYRAWPPAARSLFVLPVPTPQWLPVTIDGLVRRRVVRPSGICCAS